MSEQPAGFMTKREYAVRVIRERILDGTYPPGQELTQSRLAQELGTGTTPVREAVLDLMARGLLEHHNHQTVRVAASSLERVRQIYAVRRLLEGSATRLAVPNLGRPGIAALGSLLTDMQAAKLKGDVQAMRRADTAFHDHLYSQCGNAVLCEQIRLLWDSFPRYLLWVSPERVARSVREHMRIQSAIRRGAADEAASEIENNLQQGFLAFEAAVSAAG